MALTFEIGNIKYCNVKDPDGPGILQKPHNTYEILIICHTDVVHKVERRKSDFIRLHSKLKTESTHSGGSKYIVKDDWRHLPKLPWFVRPKALFSRELSESCKKTRRKKFSRYLNQVAQCSLLRENFHFIVEFLEMPIVIFKQWYIMQSLIDIQRSQGLLSHCQKESDFTKLSSIVDKLGLNAGVGFISDLGKGFEDMADQFGQEDSLARINSRDNSAFIQQDFEVNDEFPPQKDSEYEESSSSSKEKPERSYSSFSSQTIESTDDWASKQNQPQLQNLQQKTKINYQLQHQSTFQRRKATVMNPNEKRRSQVVSTVSQKQTLALVQLDAFLRQSGVICQVSTPREFKQLVKQLHKIVKKKSAQVDKLKKYRKFVYTIACNVPESVFEEGIRNKVVAKTSTKQFSAKEKKGYFYLETLEFKL